jgi:hypothetical protein
LITGIGTRSRITPLTDLRPFVIFVLLCWTVIS